MHIAAIAQPAVQRLELELAAAANPLEAAGEIIQGLPGSAQRAATGIANIPAGLLALAQAITSGTEAQVTAIVNNFISAPLWIADPTLIASNAALPKSIGQGGNLLTGATNNLVASLRNLVLYQTTAVDNSAGATRHQKNHRHH